MGHEYSGPEEVGPSVCTCQWPHPHRGSPLSARLPSVTLAKGVEMAVTSLMVKNYLHVNDKLALGNHGTRWHVNHLRLLTATSLHCGVEKGFRSGRRVHGCPRMPRHLIIVFQSTWKWVAHGPEECAGVTECEGARQPPVSRGCSRTVTLGPRTLPTAIVWKLNLWKHINSFQVTIKRNETDKTSSCFCVCQATWLGPN